MRTTHRGLAIATGVVHIKAIEKGDSIPNGEGGLEEERVERFAVLLRVWVYECECGCECMSVSEGVSV